MGVILLRGQRGSAGHASEDKKKGVGGRDGRKAADCLLRSSAERAIHDQEASKR